MAAIAFNFESSALLSFDLNFKITLISPLLFVKHKNYTIAAACLPHIMSVFLCFSIISTENEWLGVFF